MLAAAIANGGVGCNNNIRPGHIYRNYLLNCIGTSPVLNTEFYRVVAKRGINIHRAEVAGHNGSVAQRPPGIGYIGTSVIKRYCMGIADILGIAKIKIKRGDSSGYGYTVFASIQIGGYQFDGVAAGAAVAVMGVLARAVIAIAEIPGPGGNIAGAGITGAAKIKAAAGHRAGAYFYRINAQVDRAVDGQLKIE